MQRNKDKSSSVTATVAHSFVFATHGPEVLSSRVKAEGMPMSQMRRVLCTLPPYTLAV
jgi:hypothetical protein